MGRGWGFNHRGTEVTEGGRNEPEFLGVIMRVFACLCGCHERFWLGNRRVRDEGWGRGVVAKRRGAAYGFIDTIVLARCGGSGCVFLVWRG